MKKFITLSIAALVLVSCKTTSKLDSNKIEASMVAALKWQEANPISAKDGTDWTNGAYYTGVARAHKATKNSVFLNAIEDMGKRNEWRTWNRFFHADDIAISYSYLYLNKLKPGIVNLAPTDMWIKDHLTKPHEWRTGVENGDQKILWWWCDALFMAPPVLTVYAKMKNDDMYLDQMHKYYKETYDLLYDKEEHLFARDIRFLWKGLSTDKKEKNGSKVFWSRGNGWVLAGLALILEDLPKTSKYRSFYEDLYKTMAVRIKGLQQPDGLWYTSLLSPESFEHGEVSGSGFYTFALAWGINNGILPAKEYKISVLKAWNALALCQQESGKVGWVQKIGAAPEPATKDSWFNFGTGAFLMAGGEILKLK